VPESLSPEERVQQLYRLTYQRSATPQQVAAALELVQTANTGPAEVVPPTTKAWQYGFAAFDEKTQRTTGFQHLPHFTGTTWQGGPAWPDGKLGWVLLTAAGGHAGNDLAHAAVRRWIAPRDMAVRIRSTLVHDTDAGDGVRGRIVSSREGLLAQAGVHSRTAELNLAPVAVKAGDTLDFAVDIGGTLNNDQFTWEVTIEPVGSGGASLTWNSQSDFRGPTVDQLGPWEQLAQVLLSANEFIFID
jgi:hypothetical protein